MKFADAAQALFALARRRSLQELDLWGENGEANRSYFSSGMGVNDALGVLDIRYDETVRISCHFGRGSASDRGSLILELVKSDHPSSVSGIEGQVLLPTEPDGTLTVDLEHELEAFIIDATAALRGVITVSDEDDRSLSVCRDPPMMIPVLYAVVFGELSPASRQALALSGQSLKVSGRVTVLRLGSDERQGHRFDVLANWVRTLCP